ncbi:carboxypeptidase-like regulatory domain-containing protein [Aquimarina longa]|uniref:carboxypeptidase-like regulatory domain-containing protein n=1 Tax=Aquimarina longa TaxID=1080221 RepID=UPI0009EBC148|nr:carboxypeptidase-like regulatory domain-containing protein [Aquimarina longa]
MNNYLKSIILIMIASISYGQEIYKGHIIDNETKETLPYVNIGIIKKNIGTVSNNEGFFQIELTSQYDQDSIQISMIGYKKYVRSVLDFKKEISKSESIGLTQETNILDEVIVSNKKKKVKILGNKTKSKSMVGGFSSNQLGNEVGIIVKIKKSPTRIKSFHASIASNEYEEVKFRLNFYSVKDKMPYKNILKENIICSTSIKEGVFTVDLSKYDIVVEDDFFVSLEWIEDLGKNGLLFSVGLFGSSIIERQTSQGTWNKVGVGVGFNVTAEY